MNDPHSRLAPGIRTPSPITAREFLVEVMGKAHELHSVKKRLKTRTGRTTLACTCGEMVDYTDNKRARLALQNTVLVEIL